MVANSLAKIQTQHTECSYPRPGAEFQLATRFFKMGLQYHRATLSVLFCGLWEIGRLRAESRTATLRPRDEVFGCTCHTLEMDASAEGV